MDKLKNSAFNGLKWLERYTKTDMIYLAKGGFWLGIGQVMSSGSAFLLSIVFANILSTDTFGLYKYVISINAILLITTLNGIDSAVTQSIAKKFEGTLIPALFEKIKWGFIGSFISILVSFYYYFQGNNTLSLAFFITAIFVPLTESLDLYNSLLQGRKLFKTFTIFNSLTQIISTVFLIITAILTKNLLVLLFVFFLSNTVLNGVFLFLSIKLHKPNTEIDTGAINYGKKLSGLYIVSQIANELDKLLVFHYLGATALATYTIAIAPPEQLKGLLKNIQFLIVPKIAENIHSDIKNSLFKKTWYFSGVVSILVLFYIVLSPFVFKIAFPKYPESIIYSQLISISLIAAVISPIFYVYLEVKRSAKLLMSFHIWSNIINISFLFVGIYFFGLIGIIVSRIISRFTVLLLTVKLAEKA